LVGDNKGWSAVDIGKERGESGGQLLAGSRKRGVFWFMGLSTTLAENWSQVKRGHLSILSSREGRGPKEATKQTHPPTPHTTQPGRISKEEYTHGQNFSLGRRRKGRSRLS